MTGVERLYEVVRELGRFSFCYDLYETLGNIADQIERERACDSDRWEGDLYEAQVAWNRVAGVCLEMERHCLYDEDTVVRDVARWARELRHAMKSDASDECEAQNPSCTDAAEAAGVTSGAAKVTRDPADDVSMSAYDLLPEEDREAAEWVREHGGLGAVEARLMPEGMEWLLEVWPKWSNGEYCEFGDWWRSDKYGESEPRQFRKLSIYTPDQLREWGQDDGESYGYEWDFVRPSDPKYRPDKAEPPAPKVLDADGAEIRVKETVFDKNTGEELIVTGFEDGRVWCEHRMTDADALPVRGMWSPSLLTHERPEIDSWERLEEDAEKDPCGYFGFDGEEPCGKCSASGKNCEQQVARDLVRRAKKLAGVSE